MAEGLKIERRHGFYILVMVVGWVLPPIAVFLRFGFGTDFFLNIVLTLCGYIPGHGHNFYLQNIRNNHNRKRTPAWATRAGLVKDPTIKRKVKTQWANRYDERTPTRADGYQDEDEQVTQPSGGEPTGGNAMEGPLLDPEDFIESNSTNSGEGRSTDSHRRRIQHQDASSHDRLSSWNQDPNPSSSPTRSRHSDPFTAKKSSKSTLNDHNKSASRRKTLTTHPHNSLSPDSDDPYFIRRASTIHLANSSSNHNHHSSADNRKKSSTVHSPTSVKSFPARLGFSNKSQTPRPPNRYGSNLEDQNENFIRRSSSGSPLSNSPTTTTTIPLHNNNNSNHDDDDGLNHQF